MGGKYTFEGNDERANMPQTKKWIIGVTLYGEGSLRADQHARTHAHTHTHTHTEETTRQ